MSVYEGLTETQQFACRVIADHARSTAFAIADGILPGNEGRNYVLRKIMRRAIYHGREHLGLTDLFFYKVCDFVVNEMHEAYPELEAQREFISKMVRLEEERFGNTLTAGLEKIQEMLKELTSVRERTSLLLASVAFERDQERVDSVINEINRIEEKDAADYGRGSINERLANVIYKYKLPPFLVFSAFANDEIQLDRFDAFDFGTFGHKLFGLFSEGTSEEFAFARTAMNRFPDQIDGMKQLVSELDILFRGDDELTVPNYKNFAKLYDTYGYPKDLIRVGLENHGFLIPEHEFNENFEAALQDIQNQSGVGQTERKSQISPIYAEILTKVGSNNFLGYDTTLIEDAKVVAIFDGDRQIDHLAEGAQGSVVLNETPFYAEAGGQVGDMGKIVSSDATLTVSDTYSPVSGLIIHKVSVEKGALKVGDEVVASVDVEKRDATRRNHTATHLVHAALKEVLGSHVKQAGSVVAPNYLRFDFTHYQPVTEAEIAEIEDLVNRYILENHTVNTNVMAIEEAMRSGAVALFGEKYGSAVRVLSVGDGIFSKELCGGTHVKATGDIGSFKITSDEAIASGVRRIRAITGFDAFERFREDEQLIDRSLGALKTQRDNLPNAIERLQEEVKRTRKEIEDLKLKIATGAIGTASANGDEARDVAGVKVLGKIVEGLDGNGTRQLSDTLLARLKSGVVVLGRRDEGKVSLIVRVSSDLTDRVKAGNVIKEIAPIVGGRGGGKPDMAEGGGTEPEKLGEAIDASYGVIEKMLG